MSYTIEGLDGLLDDLEGLGEETALAAMVGLEKGMKRSVAVAKELAPKDMGQLRNSITSYTEANGDTIEGTIIAGAKYAVYVEMGTGPKGNASHAGISPDAKPIYTTKGWTYHHPKRGFIYTLGHPAQPYLYPAYQQTKALIKHDVQEAINTKLGGG